MKGILEYKLTLYCCMIGDCKKRYTTKFNLKRHVDVFHLKQRKHYCHECERFFVSRQNLREHSFIHIGIKPYKCPNCEECFRQISQLAIHKRNHELDFLPKDFGLEIISIPSQDVNIKPLH